MSTLSNSKKARGDYTEHRQREALRDELKGIIDYVFDHWDDVEHVADSAGRGFVTGASEPSGGEDSGSVVEMAAMRGPDAGEKAMECLSMIQELIGTARAVERKVWVVLPNSGDEGKRKGERKSTVEVCVYCQKPILDGKVKRIDNEPHHMNTCYYKAWRAAKKEAG